MKDKRRFSNIIKQQQLTYHVSVGFWDWCVSCEAGTQYIILNEYWMDEWVLLENILQIQALWMDIIPSDLDIYSVLIFNRV